MVAAGVVVAALMLVLYAYLGVSLVINGLRRGFIPMVMAFAFAISMALLLVRQAIPALIMIIIAYVMLIGTYIVIISIATSRASKALWEAAAMVLALIPPMLMIGGLIVIDYVRYMAIAEQTTIIIASAIEAWKLGVGQ
jgi:hypothetical protein